MAQARIVGWYPRTAAAAISETSSGVSPKLSYVRPQRSSRATATQGEKYFRASGFDQPMIDYFNAMPAWMYGPWTLGVWGAVIGSVLLLLRNRFAVLAFALSLVGALVSLIYGQVIDPPPLTPDMAMMQWMPFVIVLIAALLFGYAWFMRKRGVLR